MQRRLRSFDRIVRLAKLLPKHSAGAGQPRLDRRDGKLQDLADLLVGHGAKATQQQRLSVRRRETQRLLEQAAGSILPLGDLQHLGRPRGRLGNEPGFPVAGIMPPQSQRGAGGSCRTAADIQGDPPQPRAERRGVAQGMELVDELHGDVLEEVLNLDEMRTVGQDDRGNPPPMGPPQLLLCDTVTAASSLDELLVHAVPGPH